MSSLQRTAILNSRNRIRQDTLLILPSSKNNRNSQITTEDSMGSDDTNQADSWHMKKKYTKSAKPEPEHRKRA